MLPTFWYNCNTKITEEKIAIYLPNVEMFGHKLPALPKQYGEKEEKKNLNECYEFNVSLK